MTAERLRGSDARTIGLLQELLDLVAVNLEQALTGASTAVASWLACEKVDVFLYDAERSCLVARGTSTTPLGRLQKARGLDVLPIANGGRIVQVYETGVLHHDGHVELDTEEVRGIIHDLGVRSQVSVPLSISGVRRGVLAVVSQQPERFSVDDVRTLELVSGWISALAHRAELVERLREEDRQHGRRLAADEIVTVLAHDIWNHLNPLSARLQLMRLRLSRREALDESQIDSALASVQRLARLTQDLLDSTRLEQGLFELELAPVDLGALVADVAELCSTPTCKIELEVEATTIAIADAERLRQALENVMLNGVRHSPAGQPLKVSLSVLEQREVVITISDQGPGISPELGARLFERFVAKGPTRGLGLGLYLAERIARAHGGSLRVESKLGSGSKFRFTLPLEGAAPAPAGGER